MATGITDLSKYAGLTADNAGLQVDYKPLNFEKLLQAKALRVTHQGDSQGGYNKDPGVGFSLVSGYNDASSTNEGTNFWPDNPKFYPIVKKMLETAPHNIGAYKYQQILQSARDLGLKDEDIFIQPTNKPVAMFDGYRAGGRVRMI